MLNDTQFKVFDTLFLILRRNIIVNDIDTPKNPMYNHTEVIK